VVFPSASRCRDCTSDRSQTHPFQLVTVRHITIRRCVVLVLKTSLNDLWEKWNCKINILKSVEDEVSLLNLRVPVHAGMFFILQSAGYLACVCEYLASSSRFSINWLQEAALLFHSLRMAFYQHCYIKKVKSLPSVLCCSLQTRCGIKLSPLSRCRTSPMAVEVSSESSLVFLSTVSL
jgi:hypothetical protein